MEITPYGFCGKTVRTTIDEKDGLWWVVADVCRVLGLGNTTAAIKHLKDNEKMTFTISKGQNTRGGAQSYSIINEPGLYRLLLRTNSKKAEKFQQWVLYDLIPTVRKTGSYSIEKQQPQLPQNYEEALEHLLISVKEVRKLKASEKILIPQAKTLEQIGMCDGIVSFTKAAKILDVKPGQFIDRLLILKVLYRDKTSARTLLPFQYYVDHNWFEVKTVGPEKKYTQTLVTQFGLTKLGARFNRI